LLFLDFDGVICNSEAECFASSWMAYYESLHPPAASAVALRLRQRFGELRPLIRSGEDYVVIQQLLGEEARSGQEFPADQVEFDRMRDQIGGERIAVFKGALADTRARFLAERRATWLALNPLYTHLRDLLSRSPLAGIRILSTKAPALIGEILGANQIEFPAHAILYAPSKPGGQDVRKLDLIAEELNRSGRSRALFVEDQVDHLLGPSAVEVGRYLCDWGYALPAVLANTEWLEEEQIALLRANQLEELFAQAAP
jgi:phosphoglycolate phosphatase-like HAD superfamily hydrolase